MNTNLLEPSFQFIFFSKKKIKNLILDGLDISSTLEEMLLALDKFEITNNSLFRKNYLYFINSLYEDERIELSKKKTKRLIIDSPESQLLLEKYIYYMCLQEKNGLENYWFISPVVTFSNQIIDEQKDLFTSIVKNNDISNDPTIFHEMNFSENFFICDYFNITNLIIDHFSTNTTIRFKNITSEDEIFQEMVEDVLNGKLEVYLKN